MYLPIFQPSNNEGQSALTRIPEGLMCILSDGMQHVLFILHFTLALYPATIIVMFSESRPVRHAPGLARVN